MSCPVLPTFRQRPEETTTHNHCSSGATARIPLDIDEIQGFNAEQMLIRQRDERGQHPPVLVSHAASVLLVQLNVAIMAVRVQALRAPDKCNVDELARDAVAVEEGLRSDDHARYQAAQDPCVDLAVIVPHVGRTSGAFQRPM